MNVSSLKTPGVYINEIDAFPPSIAQVATAIPAFVGYTAKGPTIPTRISSFMEFEQLFGGAPLPKAVVVELDANLVPTDNSTVTESHFKLYNSIRLFYTNGGGVCYIVSIGNYAATITDDTKFTAGLDLLRKFDEPTLLLFPDAVNLTGQKLGLVHQQALKQCADLMDRFTVMDVKQETNLIADSAAFRDNVGNQNMKYGSSYYPYLKTGFPYTYRFNDINGTAAGKVDFGTIYSSDAKIKPMIDSFSSLYNDVYNVSTGLIKKWDVAKGANPKIDTVTNFGEVGTFVTNIWGLLKIYGKPSTLVNAGLKTYLNTTIPISLRPFAQKLVDFESRYLATTAGYTVQYSTAGIKGAFDDIPWKEGAVDFKPSESKLPVQTNLYVKLITSDPATTDTTPDYAKIKAQLNKLHTAIVIAMDGLSSSTEKYVVEDENNLTSSIPIYAAIVTKLSQTMNTVPPSGAMVGIYAQTDASRGVWKSPANVSVSGIIGLTADINDADQEDMNIHETGKSINAIRKFTGKGFIVWGGRTLAGNSNDWRYINVRRLANMIEESAKKACMQFVFEPNVAQTWASVKGMLDNYLTTLWNDGALAGGKAEHAFFVQVGLNETMSALDILEGRMIVKIGYAPSRPAEFIILEFKQMQQRS
jgi:phage tail sheath protein FI